jgi:predicted transcriptional regulator
MTLAATSLKLPQRLKSRVERLTRRSKESPHAFMIRAIEEQVHAEELHSRFLADAAQADKAMQRTGLGYAAADVHAYLEAKVAGRTAREPKPVRWRR